MSGDLRLCPACGGTLGLWCGEIHVCRRCGTSCRGAREDTGWGDAHYAGYYDQVVELSPLTSKQLKQWAAQLAGYKKNGRILEVGCGTGHFLAAAQEAGFEAWGTEISASGLRRLEERGFKAFAGELPALGLKTGHFDAVVLFEVLEHLQDPGAYLLECRRLVREGGALLLTTPNFNSLSRRLLGEKWRVVDPEHVVLFTSAGLRRALERAGFRVRTLRSRNLDPTEIRRWLKGEPARAGDHRQGQVDSCREAIQAHAFLQVLKGLANAALRVLRMGDTLEGWAER